MVNKIIWTLDKLNQIKAMIDKGMSTREIGDVFGVTKNTIVGITYKHKMHKTDAQILKKRIYDRDNAIVKVEVRCINCHKEFSYKKKYKGAERMYCSDACVWDAKEKRTEREVQREQNRITAPRRYTIEQFLNPPKDSKLCKARCGFFALPRSKTCFQHAGH